MILYISCWFPETQIWWFRYPDAGLCSNYCRNPDGESTAWCFTSPKYDWGRCNIPICPGKRKIYRFVRCSKIQQSIHKARSVLKCRINYPVASTEMPCCHFPARCYLNLIYIWLDRQSGQSIQVRAQFWSPALVSNKPWSIVSISVQKIGYSNLNG